ILMLESVGWMQCKFILIIQIEGCLDFWIVLKSPKVRAYYAIIFLLLSVSVLVSAGLVSGSSQTTLANGPQQSGCVTPIGLVGWWGGNGNSNDVLKNNAKLMGVATYGLGPYSAWTKL